MAAHNASIASPEEDSVRPLSLDIVLGRCTTVRALIEESLRDLALVNQEHDCADPGRQPVGNSALERAGFIETRLNEASQVLAVVSRALAGEIRDRRMLNHQFAAIQELIKSADSVPPDIQFSHDTGQSLPHRNSQRRRGDLRRGTGRRTRRQGGGGRGHGMCERLAAIGGRLDVGGEFGMRLRAWLPS